MKGIRPLAVLLALLCTACPPPSASGSGDPPGTVPAGAKQIAVDQFGWRPGSRMVAVFAEPVLGFNNNVAYELPAAGAPFQVRSSADNAVVYTGSLSLWKTGTPDSQSGDKAAWADFTGGVTQEGMYYLYDPANNIRSYDFQIKSDIYNQMLKTAVRAFYYQRCGSPGVTMECGGDWHHSACHTGDTAARLWINGVDQGQPKDVSGGWHDAGDYNKYVPFTLDTLWHLMTAYEMAPNKTAFRDDWGIPESNNGIPDLLDEIKYELDLLMRMQNADGSVCNRVGVLTYAEDYPQDDQLPRYYTQATTWAASTMAGLCAHGARLFSSFNSAYADQLRSAAENAWTWLETKTTLFPASGKDGGGTGGGGSHFAAAEAGSDAADDARRRLFAAAELYKTTGAAKYRTFFELNYNSSSLSDGGHHPIASNYFDPSASWITQIALIVYASTLYPTDAGIVNSITNSLKNGIEWNVTAPFVSQSDPYQAYMWDGHYCWGSNALKMHWALLPLLGISLNVNPVNISLYKTTAEEYLHYIHGRNPLSIVYLTNMGTKGADAGGDNCVMEAYHGWFHDGSNLYDGASSLYGQAPGFLAGGPNRYFSIADIVPPSGQPPQKSFKDWNTGWNLSAGRNENSWEITEPAIYYQAAYVAVLAYFCAP